MTIQLQGVTKQFGSFVAVDNVSLDLPSGLLTALLGPSGSGKSTLLRIIGGLEVPERGMVSFDGADVTRSAPQSRGIGFVFQQYAVFPHMTVFENVAFGLRVRRLPKREIERRVGDLLSVTELSGFGDRYPAHLSGGQQQRVALARALAVRPPVLLLDEPFAALDTRVRMDLREWLRRLHSSLGVTTVLVTHDQEEAMAVADHVVVIKDGQVQQVGRPLELYEQPTNAFVMGFVGPVTRLIDGAYVRPHDLVLHLDRENPVWQEAVIDRVTLLGFEVRVELNLVGGQPVWAQITRNEYARRQLQLQTGRRVFVEALRARHFDNRVQ
jgi:sulfate transport system ATP-binding protein